MGKPKARHPFIRFKSDPTNCGYDAKHHAIKAAIYAAVAGLGGIAARASIERGSWILAVLSVGAFLIFVGVAILNLVAMRKHTTRDITDR